MANNLFLFVQKSIDWYCTLWTPCIDNTAPRILRPLESWDIKATETFKMRYRKIFSHSENFQNNLYPFNKANDQHYLIL